MSDEDDKLENDMADLFLERLKRNGVATMNVSDGALFAFRRG